MQQDAEIVSMNSSHTKSIYNYTNCKRKLLHCNANISFNKTCLRMKLVQKYAKIKIPINNEVARKNKHKLCTLKIR
jgi:hypothetical protein